MDNPELFDIFIEPTTSESTKFVFSEKYISYDNIERFRPYAATNFVVTKNETDITLSTTTYTDGQLFYFYDSAEDVVKSYSSTTNTLTTSTDYRARRGRSSIDFQYKHHAGQETRIDPSVSNIVDVYLLERTYDKISCGSVMQAFSTHLNLYQIRSYTILSNTRYCLVPVLRNNCRQLSRL